LEFRMSVRNLLEVRFISLVHYSVFVRYGWVLAPFV